MRREIQIHFQNCGQLSWHEEIEDVDAWLKDLSHEKKVVAHEKETGRSFFFDMSRVTAIIVVNKILENDSDPYRSLYAVEKGQVEQDDKFQR